MLDGQGVLDPEPASRSSCAKRQYVRRVFRVTAATKTSIGRTVRRHQAPVAQQLAEHDVTHAEAERRQVHPAECSSRLSYRPPPQMARSVLPASKSSNTVPV